ncbi:MAG: hypothetical protein NTV37_06885 [Proteobacteria bacterium]|nr:hypothetical protein [Pseudomonadota bacterium]
MQGRGSADEVTSILASGHAIAGATTIDKARGTLLAAAAYENLLATLFKRPHAVIARIEQSLRAFHYTVFERHAAEAKRLHLAILTEIGHDAARADVLPDAYRLAMARVLDLVRRSAHPPI